MIFLFSSYNILYIRYITLKLLYLILLGLFNIIYWSTYEISKRVLYYLSLLLY